MEENPGMQGLLHFFVSATAPVLRLWAELFCVEARLFFWYNMCVRMKPLRRALSVGCRHGKTGSQNSLLNDPGKENCMNIYISLLLFSLIILLYWVISELFTFFFRLTGLPAERARFQVLSLLTGTGFTTRESEMILGSRIRRRLARVTMLFGYVFNVTIVSAFVNVFLTMKLVTIERQYIGILIPMGTVAMIFVFMRVPKIHAWGENLLRHLVDQALDRQETFNAVLLLDYIGADSIAQVTLRHIPEEYRGLSLVETRLRAETGILVMLVEHKGGKPMPAQANTVFEIGDKLTVFGNYNMICKSFHAREHFADN